METQNYSNHSRYVPAYHYYTPLLLLLLLIGSVVDLAKPELLCGRLSGVLFVLVSIVSAITWFYYRTFALRAQDRAIRAEESFRYFALTGKRLPSKLTLGQIIGLRFAEDVEFVELVPRAVAENLSGGDIKKAIKNWRPDHHRA